MNFSKNIIIFKNDAVGDLVQSISSINNIIKHNPRNKIIIYLSERSKDFSFFVNITLFLYFRNSSNKIFNSL